MVVLLFDICRLHRGTGLFLFLFFRVFLVVLTFESVDEILTCDHSNESY